MNVYSLMIRGALAALAGTLPRRIGERLGEWLPMSAMAIPSALIPMAFAIGIGLPGFLRYGHEVTSANIDIGLQIAEQAPREGTILPLGLSPATFFGFMLATPVGLLVVYLTGSGLFRTISALLGEPRGDPILTLIDRSVLTGARRASDAQADARRRRAEGPEVADRLLTGEQFGMPDFDYVVVASRRKAGWEDGVIALTDRGSYRIGPPFDRELRGGLRAVYPLTVKSELEVMRRHVRYEFTA